MNIIGWMTTCVVTKPKRERLGSKNRQLPFQFWTNVYIWIRVLRKRFYGFTVMNQHLIAEKRLSMVKLLTYEVWHEKIDVVSHSARFEKLLDLR